MMTFPSRDIPAFIEDTAFILKHDPDITADLMAMRLQMSQRTFGRYLTASGEYGSTLRAKLSANERLGLQLIYAWQCGNPSCECMRKRRANHHARRSGEVA